MYFLFYPKCFQQKVYFQKQGWFFSNYDSNS